MARVVFSTSEQTAPSTLARIGPGLALVAVATALAMVISRLITPVSSLVAAVVIGAAIAAMGGVTERTAAGLTFAAKRILRVGVVLLGLRLSLGQVAELGGVTLMIVIATVTATFFGTQALGRRLGLSRDLSLLVATGYSICGASAIAAVEGATDAEEEEVAASIGLVTLCGTLAMFLLPQLAGLLDLSDQQFGTWMGASIHDVAQVVAAGSMGGADVLAVAVVVKLTRVSLLAPIVAGVNISRRNERADVDGSRPSVLPLFVVGFLAMVLVRTSGVLSADVLSGAKTLEGILLTAALVGLGSGVRVAAMRKLGATPLLLGLLAWIVVASVSLLGILIAV